MNPGKWMFGAGLTPRIRPANVTTVSRHQTQFSMSMMAMPEPGQGRASMMEGRTS